MLPPCRPDTPTQAPCREGVLIMAVARVTEIIAGSKKSFEDAVEQGVKRAAETLKHIATAWIADQEVIVANGKIKEYKVRMKVTFVLDDSK